MKNSRYVFSAGLPSTLPPNTSPWKCKSLSFLNTQFIIFNRKHQQSVRDILGIVSKLDLR